MARVIQRKTLAMKLLASVPVTVEDCAIKDPFLFSNMVISSFNFH
jgi:hypothetical protein